MNSVSTIVYVVAPDTFTFLCIDGVGVTVGVVVGVGELSVIVISASTPLQGFIVGVTDGVGVGVSQVIVGSGVKSQSNNAVKSTVKHTLGVGVGVGVGQGPSLHNSSSISGQLEKQGVFPNRIQLPPNVFDKHH